jgi:hypothetical protein
MSRNGKGAEDEFDRPERARAPRYKRKRLNNNSTKLGHVHYAARGLKWAS